MQYPVDRYTIETKRIEEREAVKKGVETTCLQTPVIINIMLMVIIVKLKVSLKHMRLFFLIGTSMFFILACESSDPPSPKQKYTWVKLLKQCPSEFAPSQEQLSQESKDLFAKAKALQKENVFKYAEAIREIYKESAELGNPYAMYELMNLSYSGEGGMAIHKEMSLYWAQEIYKLDTPMGDYVMSQVYKFGLGVDIDKDKAEDYLNKAAQRGHGHAQYLVGVLLKTQLHESKDSRTILKCAMEQGKSREAATALAVFYESNREFEKAYKIYREAAKLGSRRAISILQKAYSHRLHWQTFGLKKDVERASCLQALIEEANDSEDLTFPDLDERCPANIAEAVGRH